MSDIEIQRQHLPVPIESLESTRGLALVGLSPRFPILLSGLNDVLGKAHKTQFTGLTFSLSPETDYPTPTVTVKRTSVNKIAVDMDADIYDSESSKGRLSVTGGDFICNQRLGSLQDLVRKLFPKDGTKISLKSHSTIIPTDTEEKNVSDDFLNISVDDIRDTDIFSVTLEYLLYPDGYKKPFMTFRLPPENPRQFTERLLWINECYFEGCGNEIEQALEGLTSFFDYDMWEDSDIVK